MIIVLNDLYLSLTDGDRPNRRDDWRRGLTSSRGGHASQAGRGSRVSELQKNSAGNTPASSRDSDVESNASVGDHMDELQRKRIELLSQLKVCIPLLMTLWNQSYIYQNLYNLMLV